MIWVVTVERLFDSEEAALAWVKKATKWMDSDDHQWSELSDDPPVRVWEHEDQEPIITMKPI